MPGALHDGHDFALDAVHRGASCLVVEHVLTDVPDSVTQVVVPDARRAIGPLAAWFYGDPSASLRVVGVTGTNGKTTTVALLAAIFSAAGMVVETLGTLSGARTTPEADDLQREMHRMVDGGTQALAMEVSSHALDLHRVDGAHFECAIFTNLSRDHLDHHGDMESYFAAKARLFEPGRASVAVVNTGDPWGRRLAELLKISCIGFSVDDAEGVVLRADSVEFGWRGSAVRVPLGGRFTVENALAAITAADSMGIDRESIVRGCASVAAVKGRFELVPNTVGIDVVVDYAHTPDGLEALIASAREICSGRLTVVFGCGGERDRGKRAPMGAAAAAADRVVVTSDNPRGEDPMVIIDEIVSGVRGRGVEPDVEPDRAVAIASAISASRRGDMVLIAGKGHEATQEIAGVLHPFVDADVAAAALESRKGDNA
jgi:UDP-N-acetylmuramoyl-L-alanyl-D-glutamate--2,6-diaminopimelate ligase